MERKIDDSGRIVIPKDMKNQLGLKDNSIVNIDINDNEIIITNPKRIKSTEEIKRKINDIYECEYATTYNEGYIAALNWVLNNE